MPSEWPTTEWSFEELRMEAERLGDLIERMFVAEQKCWDDGSPAARSLLHRKFLEARAALTDREAGDG